MMTSPILIHSPVTTKRGICLREIKPPFFSFIKWFTFFYLSLYDYEALLNLLLMEFLLFDRNWLLDLSTSAAMMRIQTLV